MFEQKFQVSSKFKLTIKAIISTIDKMKAFTLRNKCVLPPLRFCLTMNFRMLHLVIIFVSCAKVVNSECGAAEIACPLYGAGGCDTVDTVYNPFGSPPSFGIWFITSSNHEVIVPHDGTITNIVLDGSAYPPYIVLTLRYVFMQHKLGCVSVVYSDYVQCLHTMFISIIQRLNCSNRQYFGGYCWHEQLDNQ